MSYFPRFLAVLWGVAWALCLSFTGWGRWLAWHRTWITVVIGVGVDLAILFFVLPRRYWLAVVEIIALSSAGVIARSLAQEYRRDAGD